MNSNYLNQPLQKLDLSQELIQKLNQHQIYSIYELWNLKRKNLKEQGLTDSEIKQIIIKLQLHSLDLNKKHYNPN